MDIATLPRRDDPADARAMRQAKFRDRSDHPIE
jgi:hypothetical protein